MKFLSTKDAIHIIKSQNRDSFSSGSDSLLDEIQQIIDCNYLSDLRHLTLASEAVRIITHIPDGSYPLRDWNDAISYISGRKHHCTSITEAKRLFLSL